MGKVKEYKGYRLEFSTPTLGFFSSGRGGKVVRKIWVTDDPLGISGQWFKSESEAKAYINSKVKK